MKTYIYLFLVLVFSCSGPTKNSNTLTNDSTQNEADTALAATNETETNTDDYATYFVVVADTGKDYYKLHASMRDLEEDLNLPVDTMDRYYNKEKDLIALPDSSDDEIYAGDYFPRRFPSESLSLEYLSLYQKQAGEKTIALVSGIFETETQADSALVVLKKSAGKAFCIKTEMYIGCLH